MNDIESIRRHGARNELNCLAAPVFAVESKPVHALLLDPSMKVADLAAAGVRRISVGFSFAAAAWADFADREQAQALVQADLARLAKKHRYEFIVSAVAHSVHRSTNLQTVLENAVEAMRMQIERIDAIEIFLREGEEAVLKAYTGLPDGVIAHIHRLPAPQGCTWKVIRDGQPRYCADVDQDVERSHILRVLAETHGVIEGPRGAARILGLHPNTLRFRLQKLGIQHPRRRL
jgi:putative methionine-R-sulfoxide reductase with GAF domain